MTEILYKLDAIPSPEDPRDWMAESIFPADLSLPKVFDPRKNLLAVRDQSVQGSCVAMSTACLKEIQEKKNVGFDDYMSPQFVYNNRINQEGEGMYPRDSMNILYKKGIVPEEEYPYGLREKPEQISQSILEKAKNYKALGYAYVNTIDIMKTTIYRSGACCFTCSVYHGGKDMWRPLKQGDPVQGGHSMTAVGFNEEGFIIRNSWGESWGDKGYTIFPFKDWGLHGEVWTLIDDDSSKPDPKYSKWYWKTWRAIKNTWTNFNTAKFLIVVSMILSVIISILDQWQIIFWVPVCMTGVTVFSWYKKLYLAKG